MLGIRTKNDVLPARVGHVLFKDGVETVSLVQGTAKRLQIALCGVANGFILCSLYAALTALEVLLITIYL